MEDGDALDLTSGTDFPHVEPQQPDPSPGRLVRFYDDDGPICQLNPEAPGVLYHPESGRPIRPGTKAWARAAVRLKFVEHEGDDGQP